MKIKILFIVTLAAICVFAGCRCGSSGDKSVAGKDSAQPAEDLAISKAHVPKFNMDTPLRQSSHALENKANELANELCKTFPTLMRNGNKYYIVEGDMLKNREELYFYCLGRLMNSDTSVAAKIQAQAFTIGEHPDGRPAIWPAGTVIKYAICRRNFEMVAGRYQKVVSLMQQATKDWMNLCNVRFEYVPALDNMDPDADLDPNLTFAVKSCNSGGEWTAYSFYPPDPVYMRNLLLDERFFTGPSNQAGVLRHELGHIIGCRHEHLWRTDGSCPGESRIEHELIAQPTTQYDCYSVMHYPCGGCGTPDMNFSTFDTAGAVKLYGPPIHH